MRPVLLVVIVLTMGAIAKLSGITEHVDREMLTTFLREQGALGLGVFLVAFVVGLILQLPGMLFLAAAVLAYGAQTGGLVAFFGGLLAFTASFYFARGVGGRAAFAQLKNPWARKALGAIETRPVLTVAALRVVTFFSPPTTYALALSNVRYRDFIAGSALGLAPVVVVLSCLTEAAL